ncbi:DUF5018 domain-containing protein [Sphingobacterium rhinopitheci]|uniref:DUF5018 domain-containing protein n=1 Tax=Sphingobacterium rhinopitheci TaxID=2781960 RepID=UPI001F5176F0|nr:DUF5018 domain-containing protein [Sphingobacterium rhinopitheci]MCI0920407.1 DUF5018 domain-containing protein [Sphingobacterium rhinopitheci]
MNKFLINIIGIFGVGMLMYSCAKPDTVTPNDKTEIADFYATYEGDGRTRYFDSKISNDTVYLNVDYYYPINSDNEVDLKRMLLKASIPVDASISPSLDGFTDLSSPITVTVTAGNGEQKNYVIVANKKGNTDVLSATVTYEDFLGATQEVDAIIIGDKMNFSLVPGTVMNNPRVTYTLNRHATASLSNGASVNLSTAIPFVVSSAGDAKKTYSMQVVEAKKLAKGIRPGSAKILFAKKLKADLGITVDNLTGGIAATGQYVVLNTRNENSMVINAMTGAKVGQIELGAIRGSLRNFYSTADDGGNILINNLAPNDGNTFNIWKLSSITSTPELFISWNAGGSGYGRKISVIGDINKNAIITAPLVGLATQNSFARWQVINGSLVSSTPTIVAVSGFSWTWNNADLVYTNPTNVNSDYFAIGYSSNKLTKVNGLTNNVSGALNALDANFICNAVDYIEFNNSKYAAFTHLNGFTWGSADQAFLIDTEAGLSGDPNTTQSLVWAAPKGSYGPAAAQSVANANSTADVALTTSANGYFIYMYFMFTNGYVVGVQFDCVDL